MSQFGPYSTNKVFWIELNTLLYLKHDILGEGDFVLLFQSIIGVL